MDSSSALRHLTLGVVAAAMLLTAAMPVHAAPATSGPQRIAHGPTGLTVAAPRGYAITEENGYYTVRGRGAFGVFVRGASPLPVRATGAALVKAAGSKPIGKVTSTSKLYRATLVANKRQLVLTVRPAGGGNVDVSIVGLGAPSIQRAGRLVRLTPRQLAQVAALDSIIRSRRGGAVTLINVPVPMRFAQTADFLASANVPALPGWQVDGGNGLFAVTHPTLGFGWFGMTIAGFTPELGFARPGIDVIVTPSADPAVMMQQVLPQYVTQSLGQPFQFAQVQLVAGTEGILGPNIPSAMYQVRFTWRGIPMQGLFLWGTPNMTATIVNSYFSGVAVADNAPGGISNALLQSWASANGEAGFRERLSTTLDLLADRPDREFILTPSRFRADNSTWISLLASGAR